jgi:hypothetical protein
MRYLLKLIFNVAVGEDDDDGNAAGGLTNHFLDAAQAEEIMGLIQQTGSDKAKLLAFAKAKSISEIEAGKYQTILGMLRAKLPKEGAKEAENVA